MKNSSHEPQELIQLLLGRSGKAFNLDEAMSWELHRSVDRFVDEVVCSGSDGGLEHWSLVEGTPAYNAERRKIQ